MTLFRITTGESWNCVLHVLIRGAFISHSYLGHDCIGHNCVGHHYIGLLRDLVRGACMYEDDKFKLGCGGPAQAYLFMYSFIFFGCLIVFNLFVAVILDNMATVDIEEDHPLCPHEFAPGCGLVVDRGLDNQLFGGKLPPPLTCLASCRLVCEALLHVASCHVTSAPVWVGRSVSFSTVQRRLGGRWCCAIA